MNRILTMTLLAMFVLSSCSKDSYDFRNRDSFVHGICTDNIGRDRQSVYTCFRSRRT